MHVAAWECGIITHVWGKLFQVLKTQLCVKLRCAVVSHPHLQNVSIAACLSHPPWTR